MLPKDGCSLFQCLCVNAETSCYIITVQTYYIDRPTMIDVTMFAWGILLVRCKKQKGLALGMCVAGQDTIRDQVNLDQAKIPPRPSWPGPNCPVWGIWTAHKVYLECHG